MAREAGARIRTVAGLADSGGALWKAGACQTGVRIAQPRPACICILLRLVPTPTFFIPMLRFDAIPEPVKTLLDRLALHESLEDFSLGGGTSLALRFGHRLSVDLDYFTVRQFSPEELFGSLGLDGASVIGRAANSLTVDVWGVKLDLLRHAYRMLEPAERIDGIALVSLPDLAAMKLNAIANRGSKKDFFDLAELLDHFTIRQMIRFFTEKYPTTDPFTVIRSLAWFEDAELEPDPIPLKGLTWSLIKVRVSDAVAGL